MRRLLKGHAGEDGSRKGGILVLSAFFIVAILTFVGMSVDLGLINVTKTRMQTTADAAALAAAQEIVAAIKEASEDPDIDDPHAYAETRAVSMAQAMASENGFFVGTDDVDFGRRYWDADASEFVVDWNGSPYNAIKVTIRRDVDTAGQPDSKLNLLFGAAFGSKAVALRSSASAYVEARDFVTVLDYSGSMNFDSLPFISDLDTDDVEDNLDDIYDTLVASNAEYSDDGSTLKFPAGGWGKIDSYDGVYRSSSSSSSVYDFLELGGDAPDSDEHVKLYGRDNYNSYWGWIREGAVDLADYGLANDLNSLKIPDGFSVMLYDYSDGSGWSYGPLTGNISSLGSYNNDTNLIVVSIDSGGYAPYPQEGRDSSGNLKGKPSESESETLWRDYIRWVIDASNDGYSSLLRVDSSHDYRYRYGYRTLMMYMLYMERRNDESEDLWRVPGYPFQAVKDGMSQFNSFLTNLSFGDALGMVSYGATAKKMNAISASEVSVPNNVLDVDLGSEYMTMDYSQLETIQLHHQAGHYTESTNIGEGVKFAREILTSEGRDGARWQMLVMTDGQVNRPSSLPSLPSGWDTFDWNSLTDWDGDGIANYNQTNINSGYSDQKKYLIYQAIKAVENGITIHTMAVGDNADNDLMQAVATIGGGLYIEIQGDSTSEQMAETLREKFNLLAGNVPPAKLLFEE